jgi:chemotaxis family two-component system sensor histidine kinase/response regulator PixL
MVLSDNLQDQNYFYFLTEAQDLLRVVEEELLTLRQERSPAKIHTLMRAAHTLKGAAASVNQRTIREVSHVLEDIFKAFYNPDIDIDAEVESLLFDGYECLRRPVVAALHQQNIDDSDVLNRAAGIIARLQEKFGDAFNPDAALPTSAELGFDMVQSMFEMGVAQRLGDLEIGLATGDTQTLQALLRSQSEMFLGFAESLNLPGFGAIAQAVLSALEMHPDQVTTIAKLALQDFTAGQQQVLNGDRTQGGYPSKDLQQLAGMTPQSSDTTAPPEDWIDLDALALDPLDHTPENDPVLNDVPLPPESSGFDLDDLTLADDDLGDEPEHQSGKRLPPREAIASHASIDPPSRPLVLSQLENGSVLPNFPSNSLSSSTDGLDGTTMRPKMQASIRVDVGQLDRLNHHVGELLINQNHQADQHDTLRWQVQSLSEQLHHHRQILYRIQDWMDQRLVYSSGSHDSFQILNRAALTYGTKLQTSPLKLLTGFDTLELDQYSDLHTLLQSALSDFSHVEATAESLTQGLRQTKHTTQSQQRLLGHLRDDLTDIRMVPIAVVLNRLSPVVRQLTATYRKAVNINLIGTEILVDKAIVEKLYDPLLHLVRNAFDHGIEAPTHRQAAGKPTTGQIWIEAYHQGNRTVIEVRDDGGGIDPDLITRRAVELGLTTPSAIASLDRDRSFDFLFTPGFSTRIQADELSGRGVGLDIVAAQVAAMNGSIRLQSILGQGTTFTLQVPLSLTITKLLVCHVQGIAYAFPVQGVERILLPHPTDFHTTLTGQQSIRISEQGQDTLLPVRQFSSLISYSESSQAILRQRQANLLSMSASTSELSFPETKPILLLNVRGNRWALQVDHVLGEQELVIRPLAGIAPPPYIYGGAILSNSDLSFAVDLDRLLHPQTPQGHIQRDLSPQLPGGTPETHTLPPAAASIRVLLVVDDSITLRQALTDTLERQGYRVVQAHDGQDAIERLQQLPDVDLVLCDIEMPRKNGFEVLSFTGQHPNYSKIPVVMLTSRSSDKHRHLALGLGASAYITKPYSETQLISTIETILQQT